MKTIRLFTVAALAMLTFAASGKLGTQCGIVSPIYAQATGKLVAVLELNNTTGISKAEVDFLTNKIRNAASEMLPSGKFTVTTRESIQTLLPPGMDLEKCTESKCEIEMGQRLGAEYIITGEILNYGGKLRVQLKLHHVPSQAYLRGADTVGGSLDEQDSRVTAASRELLTVLLKHAGVAPETQSGGGAVFVQPTQPGAPAGAAELREIKPTEAPAAGGSGPAGLYITSNPSGARVFLGSTEAGSTNPAFQKFNLQSGTTVRVTLKLDLYHDVSFDVALTPGVQNFENVALKPAFGSLTIESEPSGAKVLIGGKEAGTTPYANPRQPSGDYLVSVEKDWYAPLADQTVSVRDGENTKKLFTLSQDFGTLEVSSNPSGAEVALNGKKLGNTPASFRVAPVKNGKLEVNMAAYRGKTFEISIDRGQTVKIAAEQATLTAKVGSLQVYADPPEPGAKVFVDGKEVGTAPATVSGLIEGAHEVKVKTQEKEGAATVAIVEGKTMVAQVTLAASSGLAAGGAVWKDASTGLTWQVAPTGGRMKWQAAKDHCASLNLDGSSGWRLPTITELRSLIRGCPATQKDGSCGVTDSCLNSSCWKDPCRGCSNKGGPGPGGAYWPAELSGEVIWYWLSSAVADDDNFAWFVDFLYGYVYPSYVTNGDLARCVR